MPVSFFSSLTPGLLTEPTSLETSLKPSPLPPTFTIDRQSLVAPQWSPSSSLFLTGKDIPSEKNMGAEDLLPFSLVEEFSKFSPYSELQELGGIKNDTTDVISDVDATTKFVNVDSTTCVIEISVNFYLEKGIDKSENDTLSIKVVDELPQQTQCDCGTFICAFVEYVIHGRDIPKEIGIGYVHMRDGDLLWDYGKRKLEAGIKDNTTEKVGRLFGKENRKRTHQE
ncbi:hypothetical protein CQW23_28859 [Capsicum baccatum]|uniref:Ubiquitin-like protease family profile domain-containing protein n=1 Tax=Capsicum baccatum TaxID=33114 RepID=A0A2G2VHS4_CAPBA|nr:hypothetical protein CQW23_28859 [Capsicum baccatum]